MKHKRNKAAVIAIAAVCVIGGVFAAWTQELLARNEFKTAFYDTSVTEDFVSPSDWLPGQEINKDVWVRNDSSIPVFVKVRIDQEWIRTDSIYDEAGNELSPKKGEALPLSFHSDSGDEYVAMITWGRDVAVLDAGSPATQPGSGLTYGLPKVSSISEAEGKWLILNSGAGDGGLDIIYVGAVSGSGMTPILVDSVTMNPDVQQTVLRKDTTYNKETGMWETRSTIDPEAGYDGARYTMTVTAQTMQATVAAAEDILGEEHSDVIEALSKFAMDNDAAEPRTLAFEERNGRMVWTSDETSGENWFMSFTNMVPGQQYTEKLNIENRSDRSYDLYIQFEPKEQSDIQNDLLEKIHMEVFFGEDMIYSGTAAGKAYEDGDTDLRDVIRLCSCDPSYASQLTVKLSLDKDIDIGYSDILTEIDSRFMVIENETPPEETPTTPMPPTPTPPPETPGDRLIPGTTPQVFNIIDIPEARVRELIGIEDEETPLANIYSNHKCCIFHFLLALAALILLAFYTRSMKDRQENIFELRRQIDEELAQRGLHPLDKERWK